jgi:hypothetical protein
MGNHELRDFSNECIIDAFIDNRINILLMNPIEDLILHKLYLHLEKILSIECEIRDIKIKNLIYQAEQLKTFRIFKINQL